MLKKIFKINSIGQVKQINFVPSGETSYQITVEFEDGKIIKGRNYAEGGYKITEVITNDKIESDSDLSEAY